MIHFLLLLLWLLQSATSKVHAGRGRGRSRPRRSGQYYDDSVFYDYVIVGGGPAGLSTLAFLNKQDPDAKILVLEKLGRVGGRLFTSYLTYNDQSIHFENNAMRFRSNGYLYYLLNMTGLCDDVTSMNGAGADRKYNYRNYQANRSEIQPEFDNYWQDVYHFTDADINVLRNGAEGQLHTDFRNTWNNGSQPEGYDQWIECMTEWTHKDVPAQDWNRAAIYLSHFQNSIEYINYREDSQYPPFWDSSYGRFLCGRNPNPRDPFQRPAGITGGQKTLGNGYGQICERLWTLGTYGDANENQVILNAEVTGIEYVSNYIQIKGKSRRARKLREYKYFVRVRDPRDWSVNNDDTCDESNNLCFQDIFAKKVVFSIPTRNFAKLFGSIVPWRNDANIYNLITDSRGMVEYGYRVNMIYDDSYIAENFDSFLAQVQSRTDFLLRSVYFDETWKDGSLFAIQFYSRREQAEWLHYLQSVGGPYISGVNFELDDFSDENIIYTSKVLVDRLVFELSELLGYDFGYPIAAFSQPLGLNDSNVDGLWLAKHGYIASLVHEELRHPNKNEDLYVASGSYSSWLADMDGAIEAAYKLVSETLDLGDPFEDLDYCVA